MKKRIILNESQLQKVVIKAAKRYLTESDETYDQWKHEAKMFMDGLRKGQAIVDNDTAYVQVFKRGTAKNDPRYVYIKKGDNRLHDDHFYIQNSPVLSKRTLNVIYKKLGWNEEEIYENKKKIRLKESQIHKIVLNVANRLMNEEYYFKNMGDDVEFETADDIKIKEKHYNRIYREIIRFLKKMNVPGREFSKMARIIINGFNGNGQKEKSDLLQYDEQDAFYKLKDILSKYSIDDQKHVLKMVETNFYRIY